MNVRKFIALTARDGLYKVKEVLGDDAIILSNRTIPGGVEIMAVAAHDMEMIAPPPRKSMPVQEAPSVQPIEQRSEPSANESYSASNAPAQEEKVKPFAGFPKINTPEFDSPPVVQKPVSRQEPVMAKAPEIAPTEIMEELRSLRKVVEQHLAGMAWGEAARTEPAKTEVLRLMLDAGFSPQFSRDLLAHLPKEFDVQQALSWVKKRTDRSFITIDAQTDIVDKGGAYALVGPTGVGKTTTAAKLAARCVLRHGASKVALITTDGYRIGAHEQLRIYGRILGVPVHLAKDATELKQALLDLQHKHMILIDTMGVGQRDRTVGEQTAMFKECNIKRLLVLSATGRGDTLDDVVRAYNGPDLLGCILSKVDEAVSLAASLDVILRHAFCLHYVSNGQRVPEDLHLPNRAYLMHRVFKGFTDLPMHHLDGLEPGLMMANASASLMASGG